MYNRLDANSKSRHVPRYIIQILFFKCATRKKYEKLSPEKKYKKGSQITSIRRWDVIEFVIAQNKPFV